ncbi:hypothetical protein B0H67DRAFT_555992 [Lasiosphaeris hirsuta]|uniref:NACHT domain-containing protein n=1 Tax=Lasiosphaeris hirsuta TaxID=260670 RepID=A0AA40A106_9PEZI|nr:hypothetical protein B0H67DRAFT_555992 [Lasiosphaeris hirsuta]
MEPLTALSIATAVCQFVQFAGSLISTTSEVFRSAQGASADNLHLDDIYSKLHTLSGTLENHAAIVIPPEKEVPGRSDRVPSQKKLAAEAARQRAAALVQLSADSKADCAELLGLLQKLTVSGDKHKLWRSVKVGLRTVWDASKITALETRLERTQRAISVHLTVILSDQVSALDKHLKTLRIENSRLHLDQASKMDKVSQGIADLKLDLQSTHAPRHDDGITQRDFIPPDVAERITSSLASIISVELDVSAEQAVLRSLNFEQRPFREDNIANAYESTFQWIYQDDSPFRKWLQSEQGIFWVSGKAGSGKSTLIKLIIHDPRTERLLAEWAPNGFATASHYFWSTGTDMQKSQKGLLQTLLYDIFQSCPELMSSACPKRWADSRKLGVKGTNPWTTLELTAALNRVAAADKVSRKFCFFIDGLDEYNGDHLDLCELMQSLSLSKNLKLCISSRPWNVFEDAFGRDSKFYMQDLTRDDIFRYASGRLRSHPRWSLLDLGEYAQQNFIDEIRERAEGVFLWVFLVTKSLRDGLTNEDTIKDLHKRLEMLPTDLGHLFQHMLNKVDPLYHERMARTLLVALFSLEPLQVDFYTYVDEEERNEDYAIRLPVKPRSSEDLKKQRSQTERRINARSQGLLEVRPHGAHWGRRDGEVVEFLHRTVRDFLCTKDMAQFMTAKLTKSFDPALAIARAGAAIVKSTSFISQMSHLNDPDTIALAGVARTSHGITGDLADIVSMIVELASQVESQNLLHAARLLDSLEAAVEALFDAGRIRFHCNSRTCPIKLVVRERVIRSSLTWYVKDKANDSNYLGDFVAPPLHIIVKDALEIDLLSPTDKVSEMLITVLEQGQDPNKRYKPLPESTPWLAFTCRTFHCSTSGCNGPRLRRALARGIVSAFLRNGADPNATPPRSGLTAFAMYLMSAFSRHMGPAVMNDYLQTLDDFLLAGGDLDTKITPLNLSKRVKGILRATSSHWGYDKEDVDATVMECFCQGLRVRGHFEGADGPRRLFFLASVTKRLLMHGKMDAYHVELLGTTIRTTFSDEVEEELLELLQRHFDPRRESVLDITPPTVSPDADKAGWGTFRLSTHGTTFTSPLTVDELANSFNQLLRRSPAPPEDSTGLETASVWSVD